MATAEPTKSSAPFETDSLTQHDRRILENVEHQLADALELQRWWQQMDQDDAYVDTFELSRAQNRPDTSFGFFGEVSLPSADGQESRQAPVMGNVQEMFYDRPKTPKLPDGMVATTTSERPSTDELNLSNYPQWLRDQVREFVLHYFMRVSDFRQPEAYPGVVESQPPAYLRPVSWCPSPRAGRVGFGYQQLFYKRADNGEIGKFPEDQRYSIVDLRELGERYEWIVVNVDIFDFKITMAPFGPNGPQLVIPGQEVSHLVLSRDFIIDDSDPGNGDLGCYGLGYAFVRDVEDSIFAYGPGQFEAAFQAIHFHVRGNGDIHSRMAFVANRPDKVVDFSLDPMAWGMRMADAMPGSRAKIFDPVRRALAAMPRPKGVDPVSAYISMANLMTGGMAARDLCISKDQLERQFLLQHFMQHYNTIAGSLVTWRQISDWLDRDALPDWVVAGVA